MATAHKEKTEVPVHLILSGGEAVQLKALVQNWLSGSPENEECSLMRGSVFQALDDAGVKS